MAAPMFSAILVELFARTTDAFKTRTILESVRRLGSQSNEFHNVKHKPFDFSLYYSDFKKMLKTRFKIIVDKPKE